jgi:dihydroorotate dehydrogenase (NAD+) catalytic subunit
MNLEQTLFGTSFQNPVLLASGTCGYGEELDSVFDIDRLGGIVTKSVTVEPRPGNPAPRVSEYGAGMLNSIGLANVGLAAFRTEKLPWLTSRLRHARVLINVAGKSVSEFGQIITALEPLEGFVGYELNLSCPNVGDGALFSTREDLLHEAVLHARQSTSRPLIAKLAPNVPDIGRMAEVAVAAGADGLSLINTIPGLLFDLESRRPVLGGGAGGVSGAALLPVGVHAVRQARRRVSVPIIGVGGISSASDAMQYFLAGASLIQIGTASFADPRAALRVISELDRLGSRLGARSIGDLIGAGQLN